MATVLNLGVALLSLVQVHSSLPEDCSQVVCMFSKHVAACFLVVKVAPAHISLGCSLNVNTTGTLSVTYSVITCIQLFS